MINIKPAPHGWLNREFKTDFDGLDYHNLLNEFYDTKFVVINKYAVVAFRKATKLPDNRMVQVAISYCSPEDDFKKKTGKYQALLKLERGEFVQLPLSTFWDTFGTAAMKEYLNDRFDV